MKMITYPRHGRQPKMRDEHSTFAEKRLNQETSPNEPLRTDEGFDIPQQDCAVVTPTCEKRVVWRKGE